MTIVDRALNGSSIQVDEHTTLFTKKEDGATSTAKRVATLVLAAALIGTFVAAYENRDNGYVVVPLSLGIGALGWGLIRVNTTLTQREVIRTALTLPIYPVFAAALQWVNDENASRTSLYAMTLVYLVYGIALAGFFDRSIERVAERVKNPSSASRVPLQGESHYECLPFQDTYKNWQGLKLGLGVVTVANSSWVPSPYKALPLLFGGLLIGSSAGELGLSFFSDRLEKNITPATEISPEEGIGEVVRYSKCQRAGVAATEIAGNFGLFSGTIGSGVILHFNQYYLLSAITVLIGLHQFYTKKELQQQRCLELAPHENSRNVRRFLFGWGLGLTVLMGCGITAYGIYEAVKDKNKVYDGAAAAMIGGWFLTFFATVGVSRMWKKESGPVLNTLREFLIDNPIGLAFLTVYVNHVANYPTLSKVGGDTLGIFGLVLASSLIASENARSLDKRVTYGVPRISPAAAVALAHFFFIFMKLFSLRLKEA